MFDESLRVEIAELAKQNDIEVAALLAVVEVESGGRLGAEIKGKFEPLIRFEGHYFYRVLSNSKRNRAVVKGLASAKAGAIRNPLRQSARWKLLERAIEIDRSAAFASCSWGVGQVMGAHWRWLGYASIDGLVAQARSGAGGQVGLMMRFIKKAGLIAKLQNHDWAGFARAYNGPAFKKYKYDRKLLAAYRKHSGMPAKISGSEFLPLRHGLQLLQLGSTGVSVRELQSILDRMSVLRGRSACDFLGGHQLFERGNANEQDALCGDGCPQGYDCGGSR